MIGFIIEEFVFDYEDKVIIGKVNVDDNFEILMKFGICSILMILIFKDGEVVDK